MGAKIHAALAIAFSVATFIVIFTSSLPLIGLLHGPSDEKKAVAQQQYIQAKILELGEENGVIWPWNDTERVEDLVFHPYQDIAYQDQRALVLRDAGIIAAFFALILVLAPNFMPVYYSKSQRLRFLSLALPLYFVPGLIGQIAFQKTIPMEIMLLEAWGLAKGFSYVGYCSLQSLLIGGGVDGDGPSMLFTMMHDLKVVMSASGLVFLVLGLMPGK
mmetsp:Transcript_41189/g.86489  ORF Transcript_41189/g.86489 Transcript_41189/m.86489 type:complete len:217 (-) Transcript_41189:80-730(-)